MPRKHKPAKCLKCKGTPAQHNIRDASIVVPVFPDDLLSPVNTYPQHGFVFGTNA